MHYEITTKSNQLFAESVQNPNMHYEKVFCVMTVHSEWAREKGDDVNGKLGT